jgi:hypothetical protein
LTPVRTAPGYWLFCLVLLPLVIFAAFNHSWNLDADIWETAAAIRAATQSLVHPANPLLSLPGDTSPRFTPFVLLWAMVARLTGWSLFTVVGLAGIFNYLLFVTGLAHWLTAQTREPRFALVALAVMLTVWGTGYIYANAYQLGFFLSSLAYAGTFTYGVCFHALGLLRRYMNAPRAGSLIAYALLSALGFITHPITAAFQFVAAVAMLLPEKKLAQVLWLQAVPLLSLAAALVWPYFDYWTVLVHGSLDHWFPASLFKGQILRMGTALAGLPICIYFAIKRRHQWVVWGAGISTGIYVVSAIVRFLMGSRFLLYGAIFLHVAIAFYLIEGWPDWWRQASLRDWRRSVKFAIVLLLLLPALPGRGIELRECYLDFVHKFYGAERTPTPDERLSFLAGQINDTHILLSEADTGWPVPALSGARLVAQAKGDPLIQAEIDRRREGVSEFFGQEQTIEQRRAFIKRYAVSHILLDLAQRDRWDSFLIGQLTQLAVEQTVHGSIVLYKVRTP